MCPAVVSGIVTGTRCGSAIARAAGQLLAALRVRYWTRCGSAIGRAACQLLDALWVSYWLVFFLVSRNIPRSRCVS